MNLESFPYVFSVEENNQTCVRITVSIKANERIHTDHKRRFEIEDLRDSLNTYLESFLSLSSKSLN